MHDERGRDASLMYPMLVFTERRVGKVRPRDTVTLVRGLRSGHQARIVAPIDRLPVVGGFGLD